MYVSDSLKRTDSDESFALESNCTGRVAYFARPVDQAVPGLRRRRTGLLPSGPKSSFQMRASFVFNLETKVLESGGRVEKLIAQVA